MTALKPNALAIKSALKKGKASYRIEGHEGLYLQVRSDNNGSWVLRYRVGGNQREKVLHNDAKNADFQAITNAKDEWRIVAKVHGRDLQAEREAEIEALSKRPTFGTLFADWLERHAKIKKKSWEMDEKLWHRHVKSRIEQRTAQDIKRMDISTILDDVATNVTPTQANRVQSLISAVFSWAVNEGRLEATPVYRMPKRTNEKVRERVLADDEIRQLWKATEDAGVIGDAIRFGLITGQRRSEVAGMPRSELDMSRANPAWTIPSKRTKNGIIHRLPLAPMARRLLAERLIDGKAHVFAGRADSASGAISPDAVSRFMWKLNIGVPRATIHDMRRTVGTRMAAMGVPKDVRAAVLNHVSGARSSVTDAVYNQHDGIAEKARALRLWELRLRNILSGKTIHKLTYHVR